MHPFRIPPAIGQFSHDSGGRAFRKFSLGFVHNGGVGRNDGADVLQKNDRRTAIVDNVEDGKKQSRPLSVEADTLAGNADVLTREAAKDDIHHASKLLCWEGCNIRPNRRHIQALTFHERNKLADCVAFPFTVSDGAMAIAKVFKSESD